MSLDAAHIIRNLRKQGKLTLKELSQHSGVTISQLSDIEHGRSKPSIETLEAVLDVFGFQLSVDLKGGDMWGHKR